MCILIWYYMKLYPWFVMSLLNMRNSTGRKRLKCAKQNIRVDFVSIMSGLVDKIDSFKRSDIISVKYISSFLSNSISKKFLCTLSNDLVKSGVGIYPTDFTMLSTNNSDIIKESPFWNPYCLPPISNVFAIFSTIAASWMWKHNNTLKHTPIYYIMVCSWTGFLQFLFCEWRLEELRNTPSDIFQNV